MEQGICKFKFVDGASEKKEEFYDVATGKKRLGLSPAQYQTRFLKNLYESGYEPFDSDADGFQYWRKPVAPPAGV